jgi:3-oxoacyl-(acyl-carrier-protein) synthase III
LIERYRLDSSDDWIVERTGIRTRHLAAAGVASSDLALEASRRALQAAGCEANDLDLIIVATSTPDFVFPSTAALLQHKLGNTNGAAAFDVQAVCSGFVYAMTIAEKFIRSGSHKRALVVGAEVFSRILDWQDRGTCVLFGDGAGAVVLEAATARNARQRLPCRRQPPRHSFRAGAGLRRHGDRRSLPAHGRTGGVQVRRARAGRGGPRSARRRRHDAPRKLTG